ncbi:MAG: hypothetical protein PHY02_07080 [Phycisphaerae bacterium]|nr:hypothetical protein [Phycisphaerae bacterium]
MENVTLGVAVLVSILVVILRPSIAFAVYIAALLFYPSYLSVKLGTLDVTAGRMITAVLLARCLVSHELRSSFKWQRLDSWIAISMVVYVGMTLIAIHPLSEAVENRAGFLVNTCFAYFVARFCISSRASLNTAIKWICVALVPLALLGIIESFTGWQPYLATMSYCPWYEEGITISPRSGIMRAIGAFGHPIMFGSAFALFLPIVYALRHERGYQRALAYPVSILLIVGALSSMSSGPWVAVIFTIICLAMEHFKKLLKPALVGFVFCCIFVEIASNRPFYHVVVSYANPLGGSGYHRAKLIDCAVEHFGEWYLKGYGGQDPGWGEFLGMDRTDVTNEFILAGVQYGLLGVVALSCVLTAAVQASVRLHNSSSDLQSRTLAWALGSTLAVTIITFISVSFFGQMIPLFYSFLGIIGSSSSWIRQPDLVAKRPERSSLSEYSRKYSNGVSLGV